MRTIWILPGRLGICIGTGSGNQESVNATIRAIAENRIMGPKRIIGAWMKTYHLRVQISRQRRNLKNLPAHLLRDIGITPAQAQQEAQKFFWES